MPAPKIYIPISLWKEMIRELYRRGEEVRESGAFLLSKSDELIVREFICYDDLDPNCLDKGYIDFNGRGFISLWKYCQEKGLKVLCDVHTHPGKWTLQSELDRLHPMIAVPGHLALIIPSFAATKNQLLQGVGVHKYLGNFQWRSYKSNSGIVKLEKKWKIKLLKIIYTGWPLV